MDTKEKPADEKLLDTCLDEVRAIAEKNKLGCVIMLTTEHMGGFASCRMSDGAMFEFAEMMFNDPKIGRVLRSYINTKIGGNETPTKIEFEGLGSLADLIKALKAA